VDQTLQKNRQNTGDTLPARHCSVKRRITGAINVEWGSISGKNYNNVVFAAYRPKLADFGALCGAYWVSYVPLIGPKVTYASAY
jgi:hypothetical protein